MAWNRVRLEVSNLEPLSVESCMLFYQMGRGNTTEMLTQIYTVYIYSKVACVPGEIQCFCSYFARALVAKPPSRSSFAKTLLALMILPATQTTNKVGSWKHVSLVGLGQLNQSNKVLFFTQTHLLYA